MKVGTRELKNRLSFYLHCVRDGESVYVTDRGSVVAELRSAKEEVRGQRKTDRQILVKLAASGYVSLGSGKLRGRPPLRAKRGTRLSRMILEDRR